jgi:hypothetical protein
MTYKEKTMNDQRDIIARAILKAVEILYDRECRKEEFGLLIGTAATESDFVHLRQIGGGPGRGYFQMEPRTAEDIFANYLRYRPEIFQKVAEVIDLGVPDPVVIPADRLEPLLETNVLFMAMMGRLHYRRVSAPLPDTVHMMAVYWKRYYNTAQGAGTSGTFVSKWNLHACSSLVREYCDAIIPMQ